MNYRTLSLPESLVNQVEKRIRDGEGGYTTITEYVKEAIREKMSKESQTKEVEA
ncbi:MAG: ribbon-helix-helix domain-containing protein [Thermoplasmataceae archaeon]